MAQPTETELAQHRVEPWPIQTVQTAQPRVDRAQTEQAARQVVSTAAVIYVDGHRLESRGPIGVCPRPDSHALFPLPEGWTLHHDGQGRLYRSKMDPLLNQWVSQWRHPARSEEPVQLPLSSHHGSGVASPVQV